MTIPTRPAGRTTRLWVLLPLSLYLAQVWLYLRYVNDDAYITFRYSRFLASGLGPYFNIGEHVEGYTNLLQMLLMAGVYAVGGSGAVPPAAKLAGIVWGGLSLVLVFTLCRRLAERLPPLQHSALSAATLASGLVAVFPGYALNAVSGLETTLFGALVMIALVLGVRQEFSGGWSGAGLAWAAAALTRPEGAAIFALQWIVSRIAHAMRPVASTTGALARMLTRSTLIDGALVALAVVVQLGLRMLLYDAELLPNTYHAKTGGLWGASGWDYVSAGALAPFLGIAGVSLGLAGWWRLRTLAAAAAPLIAVALFGAGLPLLVGADWMPGWRFAVPFLPPLAVVVVLGWYGWLTPWLSRRNVALLAAALTPLLVIGMGLAHQGERRKLHRAVELRADGYATGHQALARWLREEAAGPGETVALMDIGIVGYESPDLRILDVTGLTDRTIAKSPGRFLNKQYDPAYVLDQQPEFIVLVLWAAGDPRAPLPDSAALATWTRNEHALAGHPEFARHYRRAPTDASADAAPLERLRRRLGATRIFPHAHPGRHYLLAVYRRDDGGDDSVATDDGGS